MSDHLVIATPPRHPFLIHHIPPWEKMDKLSRRLDECIAGPIGICHGISILFRKLNSGAGAGENPPRICCQSWEESCVSSDCNIKSLCGKDRNLSVGWDTREA